MFKDRSSRENFYELKWKLKKLHVNQIFGDDESYPTEGERRDPSTLKYLNESLIPQNKELLRHTRREAKVLSYKYVWTYKDTIKARKTDQSRTITIRAMTDISKIV